MRIASLLPSATEIVCAVGAAHDLVGVSHECDYPPGVAQRRVLTRPRQTLPAGSGAIDRDVRALVQRALAVYEVDAECLAAVRPDLIVTQDLCNVCAVSLTDVQAALAEIAGGKVEVVSLAPRTLHDVWGDVRRVGEATGRAAHGEALAAALVRRCAELGARTAAIGRVPSVLTIEWLDPVMVGGMWMPELIALAGGRALVTEPGQHAPTLTLAELGALDPDVVLIKPCGFDLRRTTDELELLRTNLPWTSWRAARQGAVFVADGSAFFNRPGPRLVESLEILAACVHPRHFRDLALRHSDAVRRVLPDLTLESLAAVTP